ncbi:hypothetical protein PUN28_006014 [Cardiocondyla obscurior]|uniref:Transmembrane protein n=1 Tax=Cardiocondyla obscurior TaxID=286306 RepID=A0AAW2G9J7_9HYME
MWTWRYSNSRKIKINKKYKIAVLTVLFVPGFSLYLLFFLLLRCRSSRSKVDEDRRGVGKRNRDLIWSSTLSGEPPCRRNRIAPRLREAVVSGRNKFRSFTTIVFVSSFIPLYFSV